MKQLPRYRPETDPRPGADVGAGPSVKGSEAIIKEARRLRRRRWLIGTASVLAATALAAGTVAFLAGGRTKPKVPSASTSPGGKPYTNLQAFAGKGTLAFISNNQLWVIDGTRRSQHQVHLPKGSAPMTPAISHDGRWLAYLAMPAATAGSVPENATLWIANADGSDPRVMTGPTVSELFGWSPTTSLVGVITTSQVSYGSSGAQASQPTMVQLVSPNGQSHPLGTAGTATSPRMVAGAIWSPDGRQVAVSSWALPPGGGPATILAYAINGRAPRTWFSIVQGSTLPGVCSGCAGDEVLPDVAGWWPKWGIGFWVFSSGMVRNSDDTPLEVLTAPGAAPRLIAHTLSDGMTDAVAASPNGSLAVVESNGGRVYGQGKAVEVCIRSALSCSPLPGGSVWTGADHQSCPITNCGPSPPAGSPNSAVTLDPAWSPNGRELAYVKSPASITSGELPLSWYEEHQLLVWNRQTNTSTAVADVSGLSVPTWSRDGRDLLYVSNDELWIWPADGRPPAAIAGPLFPVTAWQDAGQGTLPSYYGQINWTAQFSWSSP